MIDTYVYCRTRKFQKNEKLYHFIEFLAYYNEHSKHFTIFRNSKSKRFEGRIVHSFEYASRVQVCLVKSELRRKETLTKEQLIQYGIWTVYHDWCPLGVPPSGFPNVYGMPIQKDLYTNHLPLWHRVYREFTTNDANIDILQEPRVVYHGTSRDALDWILRSELKPSFGMLGTAIYFGSFWKSFRFATRTQTYERRPGAIIRCYAFWDTMYLKSRQDPSCLCEKCQKSVRRRGIAKIEKERLLLVTKLCDHTMLWNTTKQCEAVHVKPIDLTENDVQRGLRSPIQNEEYACIDASSISIESIAFATSTTEHHEPLNRSVSID